MKFPRRSGVLVHITALPSQYGIGDMGNNAYKFIDTLKNNHQTYWQILPFGVADPNGCPYSGISAFGGYHLLIAPDKLFEMGLLAQEDIAQVPNFNPHKVDFVATEKYKISLLKRAYLRFKKNTKLNQEFSRFEVEEKKWLHDLALFQVISKFYKTNWTKWPETLKNRNSFALELFENKYGDQIRFYKFLQFLFFRQWNELKQYANQNGIKIVGDIPIFLAHHSMDIWKNPQWFKIDINGNYDIEVGAAPDIFSAVGQKWGNPNYNWHIMEFDGFSWWISRIEFMLKYCDIIRLDHFRGFEAIWEVHSAAPNAIHGWWSYTPGHHLFETLFHRMGDLPIIVEDLGTITPEVRHLRDRFNLPGMAVLQMAFGSGDQNAHLPHNIRENCVIYTATHDNDTSVGYFWGLPNTLEKSFTHAYLQTNTLHWINWDLIRLAMYSRADTSITPIQDIMGLGSEARFNRPGTPENNWLWRFTWDMLKQDDLNTFRHITLDCGRKNPNG
ncbi:MAG: 4-alpha-glucanotransferase [Bdellovibrionales bacterium RIFOXYD12_FULL_39_22]|nr:MAG: 4-alpha-glucanotransferase [Bdellovibrionales bacterium RIFOXYB1_FULL_39_21]OFZ42222.1 MAG: 4-alpha-glucanotransferase [Bdellovibrionales bacterium RIFOXYC12_FULL_39_17]OFZ46686.1 MAG: 4-alpha-glucanotransferase [Bdellovibrionales bacterium RIFOXYC1_FULL_39_130]OFZ74221.1 MAG: 4-alpha-glucanotransferase [Bdellovibrionales bacterium RIFOXYC2_FULL_39_8]OFZ76037.1 MAG: 4-alpha-glucanotransferase [Bdellovibrionales bacterium RIFOXYD1_FULL_39_84]OFZ93021.1 MAG: 4-alpha-glucanotransferase [B